jgi:hypothetical protein
MHEVVATSGNPGVLAPVMTARAGRGGGRVAVLGREAGVLERRSRAVALREAVRHGWDAQAAAAALLAADDRLTLW